MVYFDFGKEFLVGKTAVCQLLKRGLGPYFRIWEEAPPPNTKRNGGGDKVPPKNVGLKANIIGPNFKYLTKIANLLLLLIQIYSSINI